MSNPELIKCARAKLFQISGGEKRAFVPADQLGMAAGGMPPPGGMPPGGAPPGGAPPMDPAMAGGMPPGGAPPMDPAMMGGAPPMDPAMMGGAPPMDPAAAGGAPPPGGGGQPIQVSLDDLRMIMMESVQAAMMLMQGQMGQAQPAAPVEGGEGGGGGESKKTEGGGGGGGDVEKRLAAIEQAIGVGAPMGAPAGGLPPMPGMPPMGGLGQLPAPPAPAGGMTVSASAQGQSVLNKALEAMATADK